MYLAAAAAVLAEYPPEVVEYVCDPRTGLARHLKWLPTIAEISEACQTRADINRMRAEIAARGK